MEVASVEPVGDLLEGAIEDLRRARLVMLVDRDGQTEGSHLVAVARTIDADAVATMLREATGMPWMAMPRERCEALGLTPIGERPHASGREMMITFEAREGITTGISAEDRALTMRIGADPARTAADIVKPGHVLPIRVHPGGILRHRGAPEAAVELADMAGHPGGATLCQVMDAQGQPADPGASEDLARRLGIRVVDSLDVFERRLRLARLVERAGDERVVRTAIGPLRCVSYADREDGSRHFALIHGDLALAEPIRVITVAQDAPDDVFAEPGGSGGDSPREALRTLAAAGRGVLLYLASPAVGEPDDPGIDAGIATTRRAHLVRQILRDLGIGAIRADPA